MDDRVTRAIIGAIRDRDRSGHEIWHWLGPIHGAGAALTEANLYPTLYRLEASRLIQGTWLEGDRIRRVYRIESRGMAEAERHGWRAIARVRSEPDPILTAPAAGPGGDGYGPDATWRATASVWPETPTPAGPETPAPGRAADAADAAAELAMVAARDLPAAVATSEDPASSGVPDGELLAEATIRAYLESLDAHLLLSDPHHADVRHELRDHLDDCSTELRNQGLDAVSAAVEATARLGPAAVLGREINAAQQTRRRLIEGLVLPGYDGLFFGALGLAGGAMFAFSAPLIARMAVYLASLAGIHLYVPESPQWGSQQIATAGCVGAFLAARQTIGRVASRTRRSIGAIRARWAVMGAVPLALLAVAVPMNLDPLTALVLLGVPLAFVAGTERGQGSGDDPISKRGVASAMLLLVALLFVPGVRLFAYDASATPAAMASVPRSGVGIVWHDHDPGQLVWRVEITGLDGTVWRDAQLEFWPASANGIAIGPDPAAGGPGFISDSGSLVDLSGRRVRDWWIVATAVGTDGRRVALATDVHRGTLGDSRTNIVHALLFGR